jgi:dCTP deaminase
MTLLTDWQIRKRIQHGANLNVEPVDLEEQLQPASLDIRLGNEFREFVYKVNDATGIIHFDDDISDEMEKTVIDDNGTYLIHPGDFVLAETKEHFEIPDDVVGRVTGRSSIGRLGITVHQTAGLFDPGFEGTGVLELANVSNRPIALEPGMRIAQMTFEELDYHSEIPYNSTRNKYQNQDGAVPSRIQEDK